MTKRVAVIGAGLTGLSCARVLRQAGFYVEIFERDRIIGGRMATSRLGTISYDHGCQYITARNDSFKGYLKELVETGYAKDWHPTVAGANGQNATNGSSWFVGTPGMSSIVRPLAEGIRIHNGFTVHTIERSEAGWSIWFDDQSCVGPFSAIAITAPAAESRLLLGPMTEMAEPLSRVRMSPVWALALTFDDKVFPDQDVFSDMSELIRWVSRNTSKPGRRDKGETVIVHASPAWSRETMDEDPAVIAEELLSEVGRVLDLPPISPTRATAHLWKNGLVETSLGESYLFSSDHMVGVAGDWCLGRLAEHAFMSGTGLGRAISGAMHCAA